MESRNESESWLNYLYLLKRNGWLEQGGEVVSESGVRKSRLICKFIAYREMANLTQYYIRCDDCACTLGRDFSLVAVSWNTRLWYILFSGSALNSTDGGSV